MGCVLSVQIGAQDLDLGIARCFFVHSSGPTIFRNLCFRCCATMFYFVNNRCGLPPGAGTEEVNVGATVLSNLIYLLIVTDGCRLLEVLILVD